MSKKALRFFRSDGDAVDVVAGEKLIGSIRTLRGKFMFHPFQNISLDGNQLHQLTAFCKGFYLPEEREE